MPQPSVPQPPPEAGAQTELPPLADALLTEALTHSSVLNEVEEPVRSNERLEYLGDAVLDMVIAEELFRRFPDTGEGGLTRMRAALVRRDAIARVARRIGLGERMTMGRGEEVAGGRTRARNLAGVFEAVIGAVFHEHGYETARAFILEHMDEELAVVSGETNQFDAKSRLQELVQAQWHAPPIYRTTGESVDSEGVREFAVEVVVSGDVLGAGVGRNKREAQQRAAAAAVAVLEQAQAEESHAP